MKGKGLCALRTRINRSPAVRSQRSRYVVRREIPRLRERSGMFPDGRRAMRQTCWVELTERQRKFLLFLAEREKVDLREVNAAMAWSDDELRATAGTAYRGWPRNRDFVASLLRRRGISRLVGDH